MDMDYSDYSIQYIYIPTHTFHVCRWVETTNQNVCFGLCDSCQNSKRVPLHSALGWGPGVRPFALADDLLMKTRRGVPLLFCNHSGHVHISKPVSLFCLHSGFSLQPCFQRPHWLHLATGLALDLFMSWWSIHSGY